MISREYSEAIAETLDILEHTNNDDINKIPKKFMDFLKENTSKTYKCNLDYTKRIKDMNLNEKTIGILSVINKKYWCDDEERKEFEKRLKENEKIYQEELRKKYNPDNLFKGTNKSKDTREQIATNEVAMVKYEESLFKKIWNKILNIFIK